MAINPNFLKNRKNNRPYVSNTKKVIKKVNPQYDFTKTPEQQVTPTLAGLGQTGAPNIGASGTNVVPDAKRIDNTTNVIQPDPQVLGVLQGALARTQQATPSVGLPRGQDFEQSRMQQLQDLYGATQQAQLERQRIAREKQIAGYEDLYGGIEGRYQDVIGQIGLQEEALAPQYQRLRDESFVETLKNLRGINEAMARRGLARGGAARQAELQETLGQERRYTDVNLQEQQARRALEQQRTSALRARTDDLNKLDRAIMLLKSQGEREDSALMNELEVKRLQAAQEIQNLAAKRDIELEGIEYGRGRQQAMDAATIAGQLADYQRGLRGEEMDVARLTGELGGRPTLAGQEMLQRQQQIDFTQAVQAQELDMAKAKLIDQLATTKLSRENQAILNRINQFNLDNLPNITKMEMAKTLQGIQRGDIENAIMNTKLEALPEQLGLEIQKMKQSIRLADENMARAIKNDEFERLAKKRQLSIQEANAAADRAYKNNLISLKEREMAFKSIEDSVRDAFNKENKELYKELDKYVNNSFASKKYETHTTIKDGIETEQLRDTGIKAIEPARQEDAMMYFAKMLERTSDPGQQDVILALMSKYDLLDKYDEYAEQAQKTTETQEPIPEVENYAPTMTLPRPKDIDIKTGTPSVMESVRGFKY